jgi:preprotein translocase subunit SecD
VFIVAILSLLQATLTLPGIAGIVLTVGMAVDANVLIFERIREEIRNGNSPQASIHAGYEKAFSTITDANVTTLLAAIVLFSLGTGPVKGFAVTLSIGIITSMFTAIVGTRAIVNLIYGGRNVKKLSI